MRAFRNSKLSGIDNDKDLRNVFRVGSNEATRKKTKTSPRKRNFSWAFYIRY